MRANVTVSCRFCQKDSQSLAFFTFLPDVVLQKLSKKLGFRLSSIRLLCLSPYRQGKCQCAWNRELHSRGSWSISRDFLELWVWYCSQDRSRPHSPEFHSISMVIFFIDIRKISLNYLIRYAFGPAAKLPSFQSYCDLRI